MAELTAPSSSNQKAPSGLVLPVECNGQKGQLYVKFLSINTGRGTRQYECIFSDGVWYTANGFHRSYALNSKLMSWKRALFHRGRSLYRLLEEGKIRTTSQTCGCALCVADQAASAITQVYVCGWCDDTFSTKAAYKQHSHTSHQMPMPVASPKPLTTNPPSTPSPGRTRRPSNQNREPEVVPPKQQHMADNRRDKPAGLDFSHRGLPSAEASQEPAAKALTIDDFSSEEILAKLLERKATFVCKCGIIFRDQTLFYLHRGTHSSQNPYKCSFCGHLASDWYDFNSHQYFHTNPQIKP